MGECDDFETPIEAIPPVCVDCERLFEWRRWTIECTWKIENLLFLSCANGGGFENSYCDYRGFVLNVSAGFYKLRED